MDIYHPVVLFKFSTKRGPSPLISPPSRRARPQRLLLEQRKKKKPGGQRDIHPASQSVRETREGRMDGRGGRREARCFSASLFFFFFCHHPTPLAGGHLDGAERCERTHVVETEPRTHQRELRGFPFFFF